MIKESLERMLWPSLPLTIAWMQSMQCAEYCELCSMGRAAAACKSWDAFGGPSTNALPVPVSDRRGGRDVPTRAPPSRGSLLHAAERGRLWPDLGSCLAGGVPLRVKLRDRECSNPRFAPPVRCTTPNTSSFFPLGSHVPFRAPNCKLTTGPKQLAGKAYAR